MHGRTAIESSSMRGRCTWHEWTETTTGDRMLLHIKAAEPVADVEDFAIFYGEIGTILGASLFPERNIDGERLWSQYQAFALLIGMPPCPKVSFFRQLLAAGFACDDTPSGRLWRFADQPEHAR